ncbi:MAG: hypothetical protein U0792_20295 [Gemmataceae bacterium]
MSVAGTVVNGIVVLDTGMSLPEGARVLVALCDDELDGVEPLATETYEQHLSHLRQSIADAKAGVGGVSLAEAMAELDAELQRLADEVK